MKKFVMLATAAAIAATLTTGVQAAGQQGFKEASADVKVRAELKDMIAIRNLPNSVTLNLDDNDGQDIHGHWFEYNDFTVQRSGPRGMDDQPFTMTVKGSHGGTEQGFWLKNNDSGINTKLPLVIHLKDQSGHEGYMVHNTAKDFSSKLTMAPENRDEKNMQLGLAIGYDKILDSEAGTYEGTFTFIVAAK